MPDSLGEQPKREQQTSPGETDWFLASLVDIVNRSNVELNVTLLVSGFLVSGTVVGGAKYFDGFASEFVSGLGDDAATPKIREWLSSHGEIYKPAQGADADRLPEISYIHMKNARFFHSAGNPIPGNRGVWWRGRLAEVSGFMMGLLAREG